MSTIEMIRVSSYSKTTAWTIIKAWLTALPLHIGQNCIHKIDSFRGVQRNRIETVISQLSIHDSVD
jgi:hypothetical protein